MADQSETRYYLLVDDDDLVVGSVLPDRSDDPLPVVTHPRSTDLYMFARRHRIQVFQDIVLGTCCKPKPTLRLAVLKPRDDVQVDERNRARRDTGWVVVGFEPYFLALGPQASSLIDVVSAGYVDFVDRPVSARVKAYLEARDEDTHEPYVAIQAALGALERCRADTRFWDAIRRREFGWESLALAARDLIGTTVDWTWEAYHLLTKPWCIAYGRPIHPGDVHQYTLPTTDALLEHVLKADDEADLPRPYCDSPWHQQRHDEEACPDCLSTWWDLDGNGPHELAMAWLEILARRHAANRSATD